MFPGLGPTSFSMPHTPDDFIRMDDNMEVETDSRTMETPDLPSLNDNIDCTEHLEPSLELGEEFPTGILDDVQSLINTPTTKADNNVLIWL